MRVAMSLLFTVKETRVEVLYQQFHSRPTIRSKCPMVPLVTCILSTLTAHSHMTEQQHFTCPVSRHSSVNVDDTRLTVVGVNNKNTTVSSSVSSGNQSEVGHRTHPLMRTLSNGTGSPGLGSVPKALDSPSRAHARSAVPGGKATSTYDGR